jgi:hypothetical protein
MAFVYPFVYAIRRFVLKEPKYIGDVDGDQDTRPVRGIAIAVAFGLGLLATGILLLLGAKESGALSTTMAGTVVIAYYFMRK